MDELIGRRLGGKYEIQSEIGRGGMGIVYSAHDTMLRRTVAVKVLSPQLAADSTFVQRFRREAVAAANLRHPNIVTIYDVGEDALSGRAIHYIVMENIEGEPLDSLLQQQRRPFTLRQTDDITRQVADALHYAHERGMIHRDVKPANIMLGPDGHVTLMDFGLVRAGEMSHLTQTGSVLGTPLYMAPEQVMGAEIDRRTDIYALGIVIYELLAGEVPFMRTTPLAIAHAHVYDPPPPLRAKRPDLPPSVESVVLRALTKNPGGRYQDANQLAADFSRATTGQMPAGLAQGMAAPGGPPLDATIRTPAPQRTPAPPSAPPPGGRTPTPPPAGPPLHDRKRTNPLLWGALILAVLALGVGVVAALGLFRSGSNDKQVGTTPIVEKAPTPAMAALAGSQTPAKGVTPLPLAESVSSPSTSPTNPSPPIQTIIGTPTSTLIPPSPTPTPLQVAQAQVIGDLVNVRSGPGTGYKLGGQIRQGATYGIVGRNADGSWWQICCLAGEPGWVASNLVRASGPIDSVVVIDVPPPTTTAPSIAGTLPLSLASIANANSTEGYVNPPQGNVSLAGVPFDLGAGESVTTQAGPLPDNPTTVKVAANVPNPQTVYLLITGGDMFTEFAGQNIGEVRLAFDDGSVIRIELTVGYNIREWKHLGQETVTRTTSPDVTEVWRGANRYDSGTAVIDMLTIPVPPSIQGRRLVSVEILDRSRDTTGGLDPAINWLGATVRTAKEEPAKPTATSTVTMTPTSIPPSATATPTLTPCPLAPGPTFARVWRREWLGCPVSNEIGVTSAYESFERGFMLWRKDDNSHYALYDDGSFNRFTYPPAEPLQFACPEAAQLGRPQRGFSQVWCENPSVREHIGNALEDEVGNDRPLQISEQGFMVFIPERGHLYALRNDGTWEEFD